MRNVYVLLLLLVFHLSLSAQPIGPHVHKVMFLGNSITYAGGYISDIEAYYVSRHSTDTIEFVNLGLPSETVSGLSEPGHAGGKFPRPDLHERLHRILDKIKPDLVFACYGMNDGIYMPFDEARFQAFKTGVQWLHDTLVKTGARVIHITPPVYDELIGGKIGYASVLDRYSDWLLQQRWEVVDVHFPMKRFLEEHRKADSAFGLARDGIHPGEVGHWLMAQQILLHLGEKDVLRFSSIQEAMAGSPEVLSLVQERQSFMKDAWLTMTGHQRPGMKTGLPMEEARVKANAIGQSLQALLIHSRN
jgi:lysophospholipase L1-like esterase